MQVFHGSAEAERKRMELRADVKKNYNPDAPVSAASLLAKVRADVTHVTQEEADKLLPWVKRALECELEYIRRHDPLQLHNRVMIAINADFIWEWGARRIDLWKLPYLDEALLLRKEPWFEGFQWGIHHKFDGNEGRTPEEYNIRSISWIFSFQLNAWK